MTAPRTLTADEYRSDAVFELERARLFHGGWYYVVRADRVPPGHARTVEVAGESVIVSRDRHGDVHAFANVCRHRGSQICDTGEAVLRSLRCPYHGWTYGLDGTLVATPRVGNDELDADRSTLGLLPYSCVERFGFVFVCLDRSPPPFDDWLADHGGDLRRFESLDLGALVAAETTEAVVGANWKIIVENYLECLHCPIVHPELVDVIPFYRTGSIVDPTSAHFGVALAGDGDSFAAGGHSGLPLLPGIEPQHAHLYRGGVAFPTVFIDVTGTSVIISGLHPKGPDTTVVITEYLFAPETVATADFDPKPVVEFSELVARQDYEVCERVQRGVSSRAFETGTLTAKDALVHQFGEHYRRALGPAHPA